MPVDAYIAAYTMNPWGLMQRQTEFQLELWNNAMQIASLTTLASLRMTNGILQALQKT